MQTTIPLLESDLCAGCMLVIKKRDVLIYDLGNESALMMAINRLSLTGYAISICGECNLQNNDDSTRQFLLQIGRNSRRMIREGLINLGYPLYVEVPNRGE